MSWWKLNDNRFMGDGPADKAGASLNAIAIECQKQNRPLPALKDFLSLLQNAILSCGKQIIILSVEEEKQKIKAGFLNGEEIFAGQNASPAYDFISEFLCQGFQAIENEYQAEYKRKPYLQEILAAFSFLVCSNPALFLSDIKDKKLIYINADKVK